MKTDDLTLIEQYLRNELSKEDKALFLKRLENDEALKKEFDLEKQLFESLSDEDWSAITTGKVKELDTYRALFESDHIAGLKNTIQKVNSEYQKEQHFTKRNWILYASAAVLLLFISIGSLYFSNSKQEDLYVQYLKLESLPSLVSRGDDNKKNLIKAQQLFENKQYLQTIQILESTAETLESKTAIAYLYLGIAYMESDQFSEAERTFNLLISSDLYDATKGYWYKALLHIKMNEKGKAKALLTKISSEKLFNYVMANQLLKKLE